MMYLSYLTLNPGCNRVKREIENVYQLHRSLMHCFPDYMEREKERVLFRLETDARSGVPTVLLQSTLEPRWDWLNEQGARDYLLRPPECKTFDLKLVRGQVLAFCLRANPTAKRKFPNGDHKRVAICEEQEQITWLKRKGELGGFELISVEAQRENDVYDKLTRDGEVHSLKFVAVQFDGLLQVSDPDQLLGTIRQGIGSGKGFGFGLLSLSEINR